MFKRYIFFIKLFLFKLYLSLIKIKKNVLQLYIKK